MISSRSTTKTIYQGIMDPASHLISQFDWAYSLYRPMLLLLWDRFFQGDFENKGKDVYTQHYNLVRQIVPSDRLLEYDVSHGWAPLCNFLGEEIPNRPFPFINTSNDFVADLRNRTHDKIRDAVFKAVVFVLGSACIWIAFVYISRWTGVV